MTVCPTFDTSDTRLPWAAIFAYLPGRTVLCAASMCLLAAGLTSTLRATPTDDSRDSLAAAQTTSDTAPTLETPTAEEAEQADREIAGEGPPEPEEQGSLGSQEETSLQLNPVDSPTLSSSPSGEPGEAIERSAWIPRTVLGYDPSTWGLPQRQPPPPGMALAPSMPLLIQDAVGSGDRPSQPRYGEHVQLAVRPSSPLQRAEVASSVSKRKNSDPSGALRSTPLLTPAEKGRRPEQTTDDRTQLAEKANAKLNRSDSAGSAMPAADDGRDATQPGLPLAEPLTKAEPAVVITREMANLRPRLDKVLRFYFDRPLNTQDDGPWSIMHSLLGYGMDTPLAIYGPKGRRQNALRWMADNNICARRQLLYLNQDGVAGREGAGYQGHPGQFLAMLAQINVPADYPLRVQGKALTVADLVATEMRSCSVGRELTFSLIGLSHYLSSDASWLNRQGEPWTLGKILGIELAQPVNGAACGGTHRIMAISYAVHMRQQRGETLSGPYLRAQKYVRDYHRYAMSLQTRVGGFSSDWFKRRTEWGDQDRQLQTTGHILEWLVFSLPRNELSDRRIVRAVDFLTSHMTQNRFHEWEVGPRGHALRALSLYQRRVFTPQSDASSLAQRTRLPAH